MSPKTQKSKKKKTVLDNEQVDDFDQLIEQFMEESERAAVILGTSKIENLLGQLLSRYMVASYTDDDPLLKRDGPLGTFSSKIYAAYRLGLIDSEFARALHFVRRIRNEFAHEVKDSRLSASPHKERIRELSLFFQHSDLFDDVKKNYFADISGPPANYFTAIAILIMRLETIIIKIDPLAANKAFGIRLT
jgi:DNA-binding MltR family transcriptional regulator